MKTRKAVKKLTAKKFGWMGLYKYVIGAVIVVTLVAVGAMVWQYYDFQSKLWVFNDYEDLVATDAVINEIDFPKAGEGGLPLCGADNSTKGACAVIKLSTPTTGLSCQTGNPTAAAAAGVTEQACRMQALTMRSWAGALRSEACQPGLLFDQRTITSDMLVDKVNKTMRAKPINIDGMHKCTPGLAGRYCPVGGKLMGKETKWEPCYTVAFKGACKYAVEEPVNIVSGGKLYKHCASVADSTEVVGATGCYTGSVSKPTVKLCCPAGKTIQGGECK